MPLADTEYNRAKESYKLKEYMAAGLAVVASPVGHNANTITHGEDGFLAETQEEWAAALLELIDDVEMRARMGAMARKRALGEWDLHVLDEYVAELARLAESQVR
jgi:glycosyltransferase involved in cell wall biosynthesis